MDDSYASWRTTSTFLFTRHVSTSLPLNSLIVFNDTSSALQFVTCGIQGSSKIAFHEVLSVFETKVWTSLVAVMLLTSYAIAKLSVAIRNRNIFSAIYSILKFLLEQGDPFRDSLMQNEKVRWISAGSLLAGIVLSNAYKNDNIYRMVLGRNLLLYDSVDLLALK